MTAKRPLSYLNYEINCEDCLLPVTEQHGCCFQTFMGMFVCDPYDGAQYLLYPKTTDDAEFIDSLKQTAAANDWNTYYATQKHALTLIPKWVWVRIWNGYSTLSFLPRQTRRRDFEYRWIARR